MRLKKVLTLALIAACGMGLASCTAESKKTEQVMTQEKATYQKKYTNADFYKDGKFDQEAAKEAFLDMFKFYGPAKHESWMVNHGWVYNFSEVGDETPNAPAVPASHGPIKSKNFVKQNVGDVLRLKELGTFHFMMAGPEGAIVDEWACYHDNDGLRFTNGQAAL